MMDTALFYSSLSLAFTIFEVFPQIFVATFQITLICENNNGLLDLINSFRQNVSEID